MQIAEKNQNLKLQEGRIKIIFLKYTYIMPDTFENMPVAAGRSKKSPPLAGDLAIAGKKNTKKKACICYTI